MRAVGREQPDLALHVDHRPGEKEPRDKHGGEAAEADQGYEFEVPEAVEVLEPPLSLPEPEDTPPPPGHGPSVARDYHRYSAPERTCHAGSGEPTIHPRGGSSARWERRPYASWSCPTTRRLAALVPRVNAPRGQCSWSEGIRVMSRIVASGAAPARS